MTTIRTALLALLAWPLLAPGPVLAQAAIQLAGTCERLVIAGKDVTAACTGPLANTVARGRTSFGFSLSDGRTLSFSGTGPQQERTEESDPLQPVNLVVSGEKGADGIVQETLVAVGACRFTAPDAGKTAIVCEASAVKGAYAGTFVTAAQAPPGAPSP